MDNEIDRHWKEQHDKMVKEYEEEMKEIYGFRKQDGTRDVVPEYEDEDESKEEGRDLFSGFFNGIWGRDLPDMEAKLRKDREDYKKTLSPEGLKIIQRCEGCDHNIDFPAFCIGDQPYGEPFIPYRCEIMTVVRGEGVCTAYTPKTKESVGPCSTCRFRFGDVMIMPDGSRRVRCVSTSYRTRIYMREQKTCDSYKAIE